MSDLYDEDFTIWTERQAALLRRRAAGELVNDAELDWRNIAEEIESLGGNARRELRSRLARLLQHLLKWHYQPEHQHWPGRFALACMNLQQTNAGQAKHQAGNGKKIDKPGPSVAGVAALVQVVQVRDPASLGFFIFQFAAIEFYA